MTMQVVPLAEFVAEVRYVDLRHVTDAEFETIFATWLDFPVLRFRDQGVSLNALQAFSERFGPLERVPLGRVAESDYDALANPYVTCISNILENGRPIGGLGSEEAAWHSDMSYSERPPSASVLFAVELPQSGGDTWFADQRAAFAALPAEISERVERLCIKHDASRTSVGDLRRGFSGEESPTEVPGSVHPAVRHHPETGRPALFLGRRKLAYVDGLPLEESEQLLDELWHWATMPRLCWRQNWRLGDVVVWDNRCVLHRREAFPSVSRRLLYRCQVL